MPRFELLLADADGTLLDFHAAEYAALHEACALHDVPLDDERAASYKAINESLWRALERGEVTQQALRTLRFSRFLESLGLERDPERLANAFTDALAMHAEEIEGARAFVAAAAARVPVIVVTNGIASVQRSRFARTPMSRYFSGCVISGEVGFSKPDPRILFKALEMGGVAAERALMLGDEPTSDIAAACAAGVKSCWFNPTGRRNQTPHTPDFEVRALDEVLAWL